MMNIIKQLGWAIYSSGLGLYLIGLAFLGGASIVADVVRADHQRTAVLSRHEQPVQHGHSNFVPREAIAATEQLSTDPPRTTHIQETDKSLRQKDISPAEEEWYETRDVAPRSWR